jgi:hypothetical protein
LKITDTAASRFTQEPQVRTSAVYYHAMGLFRRRGKKNRQTAAAELFNQQAKTIKAEVEVAHQDATAEERPNPDEPGWGRTIGQQIGRDLENRPARTDEHGALPSSPG